MSGIDCEVNFDARAEYLQHGKTFDEGAMPTKVKSTQTSDVLGEAENRETGRMARTAIGQRGPLGGGAGRGTRASEHGPLPLL